MQQPLLYPIQHDATLDAMEKLFEKRRQQNDKKVLEAYHSGDKMADDIVAFIQGKNAGED